MDGVGNKAITCSLYYSIMLLSLLIISYLETKYAGILHVAYRN